jgi:hypothetical protein
LESSWFDFPSVCWLCNYLHISNGIKLIWFYMCFLILQVSTNEIKLIWLCKCGLILQSCLLILQVFAYGIKCLLILQVFDDFVLSVYIYNQVNPIM